MSVLAGFREEPYLRRPGITHLGLLTMVLVGKRLLGIAVDGVRQGSAEFSVDDAVAPAEAEAVATEIIDMFEDRVDDDYRGWETNQQTVQTVEHILLSVLLKDHGLGDLLKADDSLTDDIRRYLIQNHG